MNVAYAFFALIYKLLEVPSITPYCKIMRFACCHIDDDNKLVFLVTRMEDCLGILHTSPMKTKIATPKLDICIPIESPPCLQGIHYKSSCIDRNIKAMDPTPGVCERH